MRTRTVSAAQLAGVSHRQFTKAPEHAIISQGQQMRPSQECSIPIGKFGDGEISLQLDSGARPHARHLRRRASSRPARPAPPDFGNTATHPTSARWGLPTAYYGNGPGITRTFAVSPPAAGPCTVLEQRNSALVVHWEAKETFASTKRQNPTPPARMLVVVSDMIAVVSGPGEASIHMCRLRQPPPSVEEEHSIMSALNVTAQ